MTSLFSEPAFLQVFTPPSTEEERAAMIASWHKRKSAIYKEIVNSGRIPARPGVKRLAEDALDRGWLLAVASTSAQESVEAVLAHAMGTETAGRFSLVLAGDVVKAKKPAPDIYHLAAERLRVAPSDCVVVEDSSNGVEAAAAAGMKCLVTVSGYTREEDFSKANIVMTSLGDPCGEACEVLVNRSAAQPGVWFTAEDLERLYRGH
jgi:HAD superfamily hydrolase (TIGR01509 family)